MKLGLRVPESLPLRELALCALGVGIIAFGIIVDKACSGARSVRAYTPPTHEVRP